MASSCDAGKPGEGKQEWPELVTTGEEAKRIIESENPNVKAIVVEEGTIVTADYRTDRVRIWVKKRTGIVYAVPRVG